MSAIATSLEKHAFVTPVFKNGTTCEANNYIQAYISYVCMYVYSFKTVDKSQHRPYRQ